MSDTQKCPGCGASVPAGAPLGHCPVCLLDLALTPGADGSTADAGVRAESRRFLGDYELLEQIGRGGMGVIFKARQVSLNRIVALKMIGPGEHVSPTLAQRFQLEAEAAANLHHPNIVPIYEIGEDGGEPFFSMKLIEGGSLSRFIGVEGFQSGTPSPGEPSGSRHRLEAVARIVAKIARAVQFAHEHGVLHRDIKPSNILLDRDGEPHLTDFGVAKVIGPAGSGLTASGAVMGTPSYMAPEQAAGQSKRVTVGADIYSLGAILYAMLTGQPPFRGDTPVETLKQVVEDQPKHPTTFRIGLDRDLSNVCMKCLEKAPAQRYASAAQLAEDLERWLRREPILARPVGSLGRMARWCRREPALALLVGGIFLSLVGALLATFVALQNVSRRSKLEERQRAEQSEAAQKKLNDLELQNQERLRILTKFFDDPREQRATITSYQLALLTAREWNSNGVPVTFGVYTHSEPTMMLQRFAPIVSYLETNRTATPLRIDLVIYKGYSNLVEALASGDLTFARPGPASYVLSRRRNPNLTLLAKQLHDGDPHIHGFIFTRGGSNIASLGDLAEQTFAFGDPESTFGSCASKAFLADAGIYRSRLRKWKHFRTHREVAEAVLSGEFAAGAANSNVVASVFKTTPLRVLKFMTSASFPWVASSNASPQVVRAIQAQLYAMSRSPILSIIDPDLSGFAPAKPDDYSELEQQMDRAEAQWEK